MTIGIFEGCRVTRASGLWIKVEGQELPDYRPGDSKTLERFRQYMVLTFSFGKLDTQTCVCTRLGAEKVAAQIGARIFDYGSWELCMDESCPIHVKTEWHDQPSARATLNGIMCPCYTGGAFPSPRPEILAELKGNRQWEFAL